MRRRAVRRPARDWKARAAGSTVPSGSSRACTARLQARTRRVRRRDVEASSAHYGWETGSTRRHQAAVRQIRQRGGGYFEARWEAATAPMPTTASAADSPLPHAHVPLHGRPVVQASYVSARQQTGASKPAAADQQLLLNPQGTDQTPLRSLTSPGPFSPLSVNLVPANSDPHPKSPICGCPVPCPFACAATRKYTSGAALAVPPLRRSPAPIA